MKKISENTLTCTVFVLEDTCGEDRSRDPEIWETYNGAHLFMLRWTDANGDGLIQKAEIFVEEYV